MSCTRHPITYRLQKLALSLSDLSDLPDIVFIQCSQSETFTITPTQLCQTTEDWRKLADHKSVRERRKSPTESHLALQLSLPIIPNYNSINYIYQYSLNSPSFFHYSVHNIRRGAFVLNLYFRFPISDM